MTSQPPAAPVAARPFRDEPDWWAIRSLLLRVHDAVAPGWNWDIRRWDGWRFHREEPASVERMATEIALWETSDGRVVGAVHPEADNEVFLELDPAFRHLEPAMLSWADDHASDRPGRTRPPGLASWVLDEDSHRRRLLADLGYVEETSGACLRRLSFASTRLTVPVATPGYRIRTTEVTDDDCARMADLLNRAFGRSAHTAREYRTFIDRSPSFEHALNLVAVAPDGSFAAHVGFTYDAVNRHAIAEPVCTDPDYRRAGLARWLLLEGLDLVRERGARTAQVDTGEEVAANDLYASCGFVEAHHLHRWGKTL